VRKLIAYEWMSLHGVVQGPIAPDEDPSGGFAHGGWHWPDAGEQERPLAEPLNSKPKYVASTTLTEPLAWRNSTLLHGDVAKAVDPILLGGGKRFFPDGGGPWRLRLVDSQVTGTGAVLASYEVLPARR
jgi:hypothetical protein